MCSSIRDSSMKIQIGDVIATRKLTGTWAGKPIDILVEVGKPVPDPQGDWICPFRISGGPQQTLFYAAGLDSMQALYLALCMIGAKLGSEPYVQLSLKCDDSDDLGFPLPQVLR